MLPVFGHQRSWQTPFSGLQLRQREREENARIPTSPLGMRDLRTLSPEMLEPQFWICQLFFSRVALSNERRIPILRRAGDGSLGQRGARGADSEAPRRAAAVPDPHVPHGRPSHRYAHQGRRVLLQVFSTDRGLRDAGY